MPSEKNLDTKTCAVVIMGSRKAIRIYRYRKWVSDSLELDEGVSRWGCSFQTSTGERFGGMEMLCRQLQGNPFVKSSNCILRMATFYPM